MKVRLVDIAHARSGDKGDTANVGVIAYRPEWYGLIRDTLTKQRVADHFRGMIEGERLGDERIPLGSERDDADVGGVALVARARVRDVHQADLHERISTFVWTTVLSTRAGQ